MQVNNVRIYLDSSSFSSTFSSRFFGNFARLFALSLGKPGSMDPDPDPKHRTIVTSLMQQAQQPPGTGPCGCEKSEQLFA